MKELVIYECGKMSGLNFTEMNTWRECFKMAIEQVAENIGINVKVINPVSYYNFHEPRHNSELEVMNYDLSRVRESDLVIVYLEGLNTSIGSIIECYEAYKNNIPVLAFGDMDDYPELHPWVQCCITRRDKDYKECINYIRDFYMM